MGGLDVWLRVFGISAMASSEPHAALLSSPGLGHLIPIVELGKQLVTRHNLRTTVFAVTSPASPAESQIVDPADETTRKLLQVVRVPTPDITGLVEPDAAVVTRLSVMMREVRPAFRSALSALSRRPTVLIVDLFSTESLAIAEELEIPRYVYVASNAWFLTLAVYAPTLDKEVEGEYVDQEEPLKIPGCRSVRPEEVIDPMLSRSNEQYKEFVRIGSEFPMGYGILLNTWEELEPMTLAALRDGELMGRVTRVPVYPIGPLIKTGELLHADLGRGMFDWLDEQPSESVLYISFGSGGTLSLEQFTELAWGLELSRQRFIWVVREPTVVSGGEGYLTVADGGEGVSRYFPEGFLSRTQGVGLVVPGWAPQVAVLSHPSVGGFLSHCGWSSTLESIVNGVPIIAWPLYAEQRMNATLLTEELGVALRPAVLPSKKVVGREEIYTMVTKILADGEGSCMRARARGLKNSAYQALSEGGSSHKSLSQLVEDWRTKGEARRCCVSSN